jgi:catechol 2,3-dioxygenase-like lactoylglutathione lyase family enzyme
MTAHLRYLAIASDRPEVVADFYKRWFEMKELGRSAQGDISLTDGWINLSLLKQPAQKREATGLSHFGIAVDDLEAFRGQVMAAAPGIKIESDEAGGLHRGEYVMFDPNGTKIAISARNFHVPEMKSGPIRLRHMSLCVDTGEKLRDFFTKAIDFREVKTSITRRAEGKDRLPFFFVGDGHVNLGFLPKDVMIEKPDRKNLEPQHHQNGWFGHIGFVVPSMQTFIDNVPGKVAGRDMAEYRVWDPEGTAIDLSQQKGFEVDYDRWERAA